MYISNEQVRLIGVNRENLRKTFKNAFRFLLSCSGSNIQPWTGTSQCVLLILDPAVGKKMTLSSEAISPVQ